MQLVVLPVADFDVREAAVDVPLEVHDLVVSDDVTLVVEVNRLVEIRRECDVHEEILKIARSMVSFATKSQRREGLSHEENRVIEAFLHFRADADKVLAADGLLVGLEAISHRVDSFDEETQLRLLSVVLLQVFVSCCMSEREKKSSERAERELSHVLS